MTTFDQEPEFYVEPDPVMVMPVVGEDGLPIINGQSVVDSVNKFCDFGLEDRWAETEIRVVYPEIKPSSRIERKLLKAIKEHGPEQVLDLLGVVVKGQAVEVVQKVATGQVPKKGDLETRRQTAGALAKNVPAEEVAERTGLDPDDVDIESAKKVEPKFPVFRVLSAAAVIAGAVAIWLGTGDEPKNDLAFQVINDPTIIKPVTPEATLVISEPQNETTTTTAQPIPETTTTAKPEETSTTLQATNTDPAPSSAIIQPAIQPFDLIHFGKYTNYTAQGTIDEYTEHMITQSGENYDPALLPVYFETILAVNHIADPSQLQIGTTLGLKNCDDDRRYDGALVLKNDGPGIFAKRNHVSLDTIGKIIRRPLTEDDMKYGFCIPISVKES